MYNQASIYNGGGVDEKVIAPNYTKKTYEANSYVMQDGVLYTNENAIETAEDWNPAHWTQTTISEVIDDKIDEVTLDPSAVALGNVHLLDEVTSFAADAKILVDSETNGPGAMPAEDLLKLTAQNALDVGGVYSKSSYYEDETGSLVHDRYIATNGGVGTVVNYTEVTMGGWGCFVKECAKGDVFKIKGVGGSTPRLWCFVDSNDKIVEVAAPGASTSNNFIYKEAPVDGKVIINVASFLTGKVLVRADIDSELKNQNSRIAYLEESVSMVNLEIDREKFDPTSLLSGFDFTDHENYTQSIYTLFDALVSSSNGLVTSFDVAEYADETYPAYVGDETLKCYKVSKNEAKWGNSGHFVKKKILIIGGTHGNEKAAPFNCYIFAWRLLNDVAHKDVFSLLDAFDFYIVPCLNLYGLANDSRYNGNGVDLNRNSNYPGWTVEGTPFNGTYTGPSADSEYETRCIHEIVEGEEIDFLVDHHNYASNGQFYTETKNKEIFLKTYDALKEVSLFCIKNWPEYFGDKFQLVKPGSYVSASPEGISGTNGTFEQWAYLKNIYSLTLEINQGIGFDDGVPDESYTGRNEFGATTFSVGEFTLRCQLVLYGQLLMPQVY